MRVLLEDERSRLDHLKLSSFRLLGDRRWEGATEYALGKICRLLGERQKALDCYSRAEGIFGPMGERLWVGGRVNNARILRLVQSSSGTANAAGAHPAKETCSPWVSAAIDDSPGEDDATVEPAVLSTVDRYYLAWRQYQT